MFNSISEALNLINKLSRMGNVDNKDYRAGIKYLKSKGYIMSGVGFNPSNTPWDYRALQAQIYAIRSLKNQDCNICIDEELIKGWKIPPLKKEVLEVIELRENIDNYLF